METNMKKYIQLIMEAEMSPMAAVPVEPQQAAPQEPPVDTSNPEDVVKMDVPLLIRLLEYSREDANSDLDLHKLAERITSMCSNDTVLGMAQYDQLVAELAPPAEAPDAQNNMAAGMEEPEAMAESNLAEKIKRPTSQPWKNRIYTLDDAPQDLEDEWGDVWAEGATKGYSDGVRAAIRNIKPPFQGRLPEGAHANTIGAIADQAYVPKVGDKIHAGLKVKGGAGFEGTVYKVDNTHAYFKNDEGRTFKAKLEGVSRLSKANVTRANDENDDEYGSVKSVDSSGSVDEYNYDKDGNYVGRHGTFDAAGHYNAEKAAERADFIDEDEYDDDDDRNGNREATFQDGDQVRLKPDYAEGDEIFTVTQCDHHRRKCWIADEDGRGWGVRFDQIEMAEDNDDEGDNMEPNDDEESANYHRR